MMLTFGTWNIHGARAIEDCPISVLETLEVLSQLPLDVVALQELEFDCDSDRLCPESQQVVDSMGLPHFMGFPTSPSQFRSDRRFGVGIASGFPIGSPRRFYLPNPRLSAYRSAGKLWSHDKGVLSCRIITPSVTATVGSIHLIPFHMFDRLASDSIYNDIWLAAAQELESAFTDSSIVGGDFNTSDRTMLLNRTSRGHWRSGAPGVISRPNSSQCFDDILYTSGFELSNIEVIPTFSDHHLLLACLRPPDTDSL
jgi:endonuclease/exonuclease/phosphatase family metal-dependent hydrolase